MRKYVVVGIGLVIACLGVATSFVDANTGAVMAVAGGVMIGGELALWNSPY